MGKKPTARDIAAAAGVSTSTVDRVFNARGGVSHDKERAVIDAARALKINKTIECCALKMLRVAVLLQGPENPFHAALQAAFLAWCRAYAGLNIQFLVFNHDPVALEQTARHIKELGASYDGLIVSSCQSEGIVEAVRSLTRKIPVLTLISDLPKSGRQAYVGPDNLCAGRVAGDLMGRFLGFSGGNVAMLSGLTSLIGQEERRVGFGSVLQERYPSCHLVHVLESKERGNLAGDLVYSLLKENPNIRGIYNASTGSKTVADAIRAAGGNGRVVFITHELTEDRRQLLKEGLIDAIVDQNYNIAVRTSIETIAHHLGRWTAPLPLSLITPITIYTMENI